MLVSKNTTYFVPDNYPNLVHVYDDNWNYLTSKSINSPANIITIGNNIYITSNVNVYKTDSNFNILSTYYPDDWSYTYFRGIYYNSTNNLIYVAAFLNANIHVFDLNLNLNDSIPISPYYPYSITGSNNQLYVGSYQSGKILVISNKVIIKVIEACNGDTPSVTSISLNQNGYISSVCEWTNAIFLYHINGTYTGKSISTPANPEYFGLDSKGRVVIISQYQISIY